MFLSLVFWTWLWGPVGAFLAVPLLIVGLVAVSHLFPKQRAGAAGLARRGWRRVARRARRVPPAGSVLQWNLHDIRQQIIAFVRDHAAWAPPIVFVLAFGESLAFISLLIPAWGALVAIGALIGSGGLDFWPVWVAGALGAALGDWLSYWIGLKLEYWVAHIWPLSRHPDLIPRGGSLREEMGHSRHFHRPLLRAVARLGAAGRRHFRNALLALPVRQFLLGLRVGGGAAHARRRDFDRRAAGCGESKNPPGFRLGG